MIFHVTYRHLYVHVYTYHTLNLWNFFQLENYMKESGEQWLLGDGMEAEPTVISK